MRGKPVWSGLSRVPTAVAVTMLLVAAASAAGKEKVLYAFSQPGGRQGSEPQAPPAFDATGNLYGTTYLGGGRGCSPYGCGTVYVLAPKSGGGWTESVLYRFAGGNDGARPWVVTPIFDKSGNMYGTTLLGGSSQDCGYGPLGCGTVFELSPKSGGGWKETVLYRFAGGNDGAISGVSLVQDAAGDLYSTTAFGGGGGCQGGCGTVFELSPNSDGSWTERVLYRFQGGKDGYGPSAVILDRTGNLYGATASGGSTACNVGGGSGCGVVFKMTHGANRQWSYRVIHTFDSYNAGANPGGVVLDAAGNLDGTAENGGTFVNGAVFRLTPSRSGTWTYKILHNFTGGNDGAAPSAGPVLDSAGNLYGTTWLGGTHQFGVVYMLARNSKGRWAESVLHSFTGGRDGGYPYAAGVTVDGTGGLYGVTYNGGAHGGGVAYGIDP